MALLSVAAGCVPVSHSSVASVGGEERGAQLDQAPNPERVAALTEELAALGPGVSRDEAAAVARVAVYYSEQLAESYDMVRPVELHNVLVNLNLRPGGLCYEMAECMLAELRELPLRTMELRRGIAWRGDLWNEHNCVVVAAVGQPFESGVVLDAWRNGGRLRWSPVRMDHYPWLPKPPPPSEMVLASSVGGRPPAQARLPAPARSVPDRGEGAALSAATAGFSSQSRQRPTGPRPAPSTSATAAARASARPDRGPTDRQ